MECKCIASSDSYLDPISACETLTTQIHPPERGFKHGPGRWKKRQ